MEKFYLIRFTKKQGKINKMLEGMGKGLLKLWALQNTTPSTECMIFKEDGTIIYRTVGQKSGLPHVDEHDHNENIEDYCPGMMLSLRGETV